MLNTRSVYTHVSSGCLLCGVELEMSISINRLISGFRRDVDEIFSPLKYYAASFGNCIPTFLSHLHVSRVQVGKKESQQRIT